jgi:tetratricopeptide (TPR) repeat protein
MRNSVFLIVTLALLGGAPALGQPGTGCSEQVGAGSAEAVIAACSDVIKAGQGSKAELATAYANRAGAYLSRNDIRAARNDAEEAISLDPSNAPSHRVLASAYNIGGDHDRAIAENSIAIRLNPQDAIAYNNRGRAYQYLHKYDEALRDYDEAIRLKDNYGMRKNRLNLYWDMGRFESGIADADAITGLEPQLAESHSFACWARAIWGHELEKALTDCDKAVTLTGARDAGILDSRCLVKFRMEKYPEAIADCSAALRLNPRQSGSRYIRGLAKIAAGAREEGDADVQEAGRISRSVIQDYARYGVTPLE